MTTVRFTREVAVKEGLRGSTEIDKSSFKRPTLLCRYEEFKNKNFHRTRETLLDNVAKKHNNNKVDGSFGFTYLTLSGRDSPKTQAIISKYYDQFNKIWLRDAIETSSFKKKTIWVYVEEQDGNVYTFREMTNRNKDVVYDIDLGKFYDIAGKIAFINLSKKNGVYKVNQIIDVSTM